LRYKLIKSGHLDTMSAMPYSHLQSAVSNHQYYIIEYCIDSV